ncbi:hypothetical protein [Salinicola aestuarinus]|uniref:hypothetical protein n=1 Tax=Salinicola aestuarinus TaxID=1949082 RepID=UPI001300B04E|nr:hypothetical protein [Salinicola aestuarinus]
MTNPNAFRLMLCALGLTLVLPVSAQEAPDNPDSGLQVHESDGEVEAPANASQVDHDSIERAGGVGRENAGFTDGGAQTPVDQRPNALSFDQLDVDGDGVIDEQEALSAEQETLFRQLNDDQAGGVTRERFEQAVGSQTLTP